MSIPYCDHSSVGVLVWRDESLLLIERKRRPFGLAPPAGHVDDHGSFEDAVRCELFEEAGLEVESIALIAEGYRENRCRRPRGYWHYWKIYRADASGSVTTSEQEVVSHQWCNAAELVELAEKTAHHLAHARSEAEFRADPGLEEVWLYWFLQLGILDDLKLSDPGSVSRC